MIGRVSRALFDIFPQLEAQLPWCQLGTFPTPVEPLSELSRTLKVSTELLYTKRDDLSSSIYGGNKVRTLEALFAQARRSEATHVISTGACGSNHAVATALHAHRARLVPGAILYPQPYSSRGGHNLKLLMERVEFLHAVPHWSALPLGFWRARRTARRTGTRFFIMTPGGATPWGALGYVSAALELAQQVRSHSLPEVTRVYVASGSGCSSAGLCVGFALAERLGLVKTAPKVVATSITPWPVSSWTYVLHLAMRTNQLLRHLGGGRLPSRQVGAAART